jgi:hypothetical protein
MKGEATPGRRPLALAPSQSLPGSCVFTTLSLSFPTCSRGLQRPQPGVPAKDEGSCVPLRGRSPGRGPGDLEFRVLSSWASPSPGGSLDHRSTKDPGSKPSCLSTT